MARTSRLIRVDRVPLAFGLDWVPLLGDPGSAQGQARRQGVSHQGVSGDPPAALGLAYGLPARVRCWSAADLLARCHPRGTVACVVPLEGNWHVLAAHEGVALARADRSYPDAALAQEAVAALQRTHPKLALLPDRSGPEARSLLEMLAQQAAAHRPLVPVRRRGVWLTLGLAGLSLVVVGLRWGPDADAAMAVDDAGSRWQAALQGVLRQQPLHGVPGTQALLEALYRQPARLAGWALHALRCRPGSALAHWQCVGEYRRQDPLADNRALVRAAPEGWQLDFPSLDLARATWSLTVPGRIADPAHLPRNDLLNRDWASGLQAVLPAFTALRLESARPLAVPAPRDAQGSALPPPTDFPVLAVRELRAEGPLRSGMLLAPLAQAVSWQEASLTLSSGVRPGVRASGLILRLKGTVYENRS